MSQLTITETCLCGAKLEATGYYSMVGRHVDRFREAHAVCRNRPYLSLPTGPWPEGGEEE